jgi:putative transposase
MPSDLKRYYGRKHAHFITCSCLRRQQLLNQDWRKDVFLEYLEEARRKFAFRVFGYVVMPEHFHLLVSEPRHEKLYVAMQVLKQRVSLRMHGNAELKGWHFWQPRYYDFNVWSRKKFVEKLRYIHRNPVRRGLVKDPAQWKWSSYRFYLNGEPGPVKVDYDLPDDVEAPRIQRRK